MSRSAAAGWRPDAALLAVALIWGFNVPIMKYALLRMDVFGFNAARLCFSALLLGLMAWWEQRRRPAPPLTDAQWRRVLLVGFLSSLLYQVVFMLGVDRTSAGNVGLIIASLPLWTAVIAQSAGVERTATRGWAGIALGFAGTAWIAVEGGQIDLASAMLLGNLLVVAAGICWASATVLSKPVVEQITPTRLAALSIITMLPAHVLIGLPGLGEVVTFEIGIDLWGSIAYAGLLSTGLAYSFWNYGVRQVGPGHTAIYNNLVPVITLLASVWILSESITVAQVSGGVLVLGGLVVMRTAPRPHSTTPTLSEGK